MAKPAALPANEKERLAALDSYEILDTGADAGFDRLTRLASALLDAPIAAVTLVDEQRQWFKSRVGLDVCGGPRGHAFCAHAILGDDVMVVEDATKDDRFRDNPLVTGDPNIRFYAGAPLINRDGFELGTLCVIDTIPRQLSPANRRVLKDLAAMAVDEMELHKSLKRMHASRLALQKANRQLETMAATDALTGIANRRAFDAATARELRRAARERSPVSLLLFDADNFKKYNDRYGHQAGDAVLKAIAAALHDAEQRPADLAARYGGEEFAMLLPDTDAGGAMIVAEGVRAAIMAAGIEHGGNRHGVVTVSVGVATIVPGAKATQLDLTKPADAALYRAKEQGRNAAVAAAECASAAV
jgi:diguanylate cyclase (GGDEF)-like protein